MIVHKLSVTDKTPSDVVLSVTEEKLFQDEWDANLITHVEDDRVAGIKAEARKRIIAQIPGGTLENYLEKENLLHAEYSELQDIVLEGGTLTVEQATYKADLKARFNVMRDIINMSDLSETNGDSIVTFQAALDLKGY